MYARFYGLDSYILFREFRISLKPNYEDNSIVCACFASMSIFQRMEIIWWYKQSILEARFEDFTNANEIL